MIVPESSLLPPGCEVRYPRPNEPEIFRTETGAPINNGFMIAAPADLILPKQYGVYDEVGAVEIAFMTALTAVAGVISRTPFWLRQLAVTHMWISGGGWTRSGEAMRERVARLRVASTDDMRKLLHSDAIARRGEKAQDGLARQKAWNAARAKEADERRARATQLKIAELAGKAELKVSLSKWRPGLVPLMLWVTPAERDGLERHFK